MQSRVEIAVAEAASVGGDWELLLEQVGIPNGASSFDALSTWTQTEAPANAAELKTLLAAYRDREMLPRELPVIRAAFACAAAGETRELIALDAAPATAPAHEPLIAASRRSGRDQLLRLRPLRDFRVTQRYWHAVEAGKAHGWHTLAYGVTLAAYAIPLRQGLLHYARATLRSLAESGARPLALAESDLAALAEELCAPVGPVVDALLGSAFARGSE